MIIPNTDNKTGVDCSGTDGQSNRVLTMDNTGKTTNAGFIVYASGLALGLTIEYTVVHNQTGTEITFLNGMWNDMTIVVKYYQQETTTSDLSIKRTDVESIITDNGTQLTLIRQSEEIASMGDVTSVSDSEYEIWTLIQDITKKDRQIHEMGLAIPGNSKAFFFHEYSDLITGNGILRVEPGDILKWVTPESETQYWRVEQIIAQRNADNGEIFRVGIIRNVELKI